jgi:hypothetical protein
MPINSASTPSVRIARDLRRKRRADGGGIFDYSGVGEAMPESIGRDKIMDQLVTVPKRMLWDLPHEAIDQARSNPTPGLRREDYTDVPPDTSPDPKSALGGVGVAVPRVGWQPVDPMVGSSLEATSNVMGGTALGAPARAAGEMVAGAGPVRRASRSYPIAPRSEWYGDANFEATGGKMSQISPDEFLAKSRPLEVDDVSRANIDDLKSHIESGKTLDPLAIYKNGKEDGRHRAHAARELGIGKVPVLTWPEGKTLGAGASDKRAAGAAALDDVDRVLQQERELKGASNGPNQAAATPEPAAAADPASVGPGGGGPSGARGLDEAQAAAARWAGDRKPLEGLQGPLKIGEDYFVPGPIGKVHDLAEDYMRTHHPDRPYTPPTQFHPIDPEHSKAIAQAYEEMKHTPNDPATKASYDALIDETAKQYQAIKNSGLKIEPIPPGAPDPYAANPRLAARDVAENNHLWFFPTEGGFGTVNKITDNPMLRKTGEKVGDHEMLANDMFRVVHDYFGHLKEGHGFRAAGEDNAWRAHSAMYSDLARPAMTTETRGQNSWVNYGPHGEKNRTASGADTVYADQKVGLMPEWTMRDRGSATPIMVYHGTPHAFNRFDIKKIGAGEGNQAYGHGLYFAGHEPISEWYRHQLATRADPLLEKYGLQDIGHVIGSHLSDVGGDAGKLAQQYAALRQQLIEGGETDKATKNLIRDYRIRIKYLNDPERSTGHQYQVGLDVDPARLLDYDVPFGDQSQHVQGRVGPEMEKRVSRQTDAIKKALFSGGDHPAFQGPGWRKRPLLPGARAGLESRLAQLEQTGHTAFPGKEIYKLMGLPAKNESEGAVNASNRLLGMDIPGMRYKDAMSRAPGQQGSHNYVMFDDSMVRLLRKYGVVGIPAAGVLGADGEERRAAGGRAVRRAMRRRAEGGGVGDDYNTPLGGADEQAYQAWKMIHAPQDSGVDYDLRGAYASDMQRDPVNGHMGDRFKKPNHPTFSDQSQYAVGDQRARAGTWVGPEGPTQTFVPPTPYADGGGVDWGRMNQPFGELKGTAPEDTPVKFTTASPLVNITEGDIERGMNVGMGAATVGGPTYRMADEVGSAMTAARKLRQHKYAEPEFTEGGSHIYNKGVENPPDPSIQTVADPHRMMYPGIYRDPRVIAEEAAARVGPEDPAMKQLFGVTRADLREMAKGRVGNEDPNLRLAANPRGSLSAQNIQTPQNTQRLVDILGEAGRHEGLRTADAWYVMDPVYRRMEQMFGPEEAAKRYRQFNTTTAMASPGSDVMTEIQRGTAAHWLNNEGRFGDFTKFAGVPDDMRHRTAGFPGDMRYIGGHPYHRTAQAGPMQKFFDTGAIQSDAPKVPLYAHASGVPETGFQTSGPVGDAHFSRGVGLSDTRKGPTDVQGSFSRGEYQTLQPWWQHEVAGQVGLESVPAQARLWTALGPQTGVESELGAPKLELLAKQIMVAARRLHISPEQARDLVLSGKAGAGILTGAVAAPAVMDAMRDRERAAGGSVNAAMKVAREIKRAKGGAVHVGPIVGNTGGRADKVPMEVPDGSYVLTADHCSAMGEGNTLAGFEKLKKMFPKSVAAYKAAKAKGPRSRASGGRVPIYAADGEFVICPEDIADRFGDLDHGHKVLDHWQTSERKQHIETLSKLAPPAQD